MTAHLKKHNLDNNADHDFSNITENEPLIVFAGSLQTSGQTVAQIQNAIDNAHNQLHGFDSLIDHDFTGITEDSPLIVKADSLTITSFTEAQAQDAVDKKHVQGTDQGLDTGGPSATTAAQVKNAVTLAHTRLHSFGSLSDHNFAGFTEDEAFVISGGVLTTAPLGGGDASEITFTPSDNNDWNAIPALVNTGLNQLADRTRSLERNLYTDTGIAGAYVINPPAGVSAPPSLYDGFSVWFKPININSGASTVNVAGFGVLPLVGIVGGTALSGGELVVGLPVQIMYYAGSNHFRIINLGLKSRLISFLSSGSYIRSGCARALDVFLVAAGGGGGGCAATGPTTSAVAGGGSSGVFGRKYYSDPSILPVSNTVTIGAAGAGAAAGLNDGSNGGDTSFSSGGTLLRVAGGLGGSASAASLFNVSNPGGLSFSANTGSFDYVAQLRGVGGIVLDGNEAGFGYGAPSPIGISSNLIFLGTSVGSGRGYGGMGGRSGINTAASVGYSGGDGAAFVVEIF